MQIEVKVKKMTQDGMPLRRLIGQSQTQSKKKSLLQLIALNLCSVISHEQSDSWFNEFENMCA